MARHAGRGGQAADGQWLRGRAEGAGHGLTGGAKAGQGRTPQLKVVFGLQGSAALAAAAAASMGHLLAGCADWSWVMDGPPLLMLVLLLWVLPAG